ncbi:hypothetical protein PQO01_19495 [Lentisphaera marina]|uniref:hypothetical protein n=1 Tax=Lentisphaera marina TaxID=1111041 RepID=UPI002365A4B0|nr:hypothetical protein [Lentisphaera marina]MDD7987141.1 hypothetical protein [Lentisphaera marina]
MNKNELYKEILYQSILIIRMNAGAHKRIDGNEAKEALSGINELSYLIHKIPKNLDKKEITDNDHNFVKYAIPRFYTKYGKEGIIGELLEQFKELIKK